MADALASGLHSAPHLVAFEELAAKRLDGIDLSVLLVYLFETAPVESLPALASQLDVLGVKGWLLATTEAERRALLRRAIELHRFRGTPYAIKAALASIGFPNAILREGVGIKYDGAAKHNGVYKYGAGNWATFSVALLDLGETKGLSEESIVLIRALVNEYKNARSILSGVDFGLSVSERLDVNDDLLTITVVNA